MILILNLFGMFKFLFLPKFFRKIVPFLFCKTTTALCLFEAIWMDEFTAVLLTIRIKTMFPHTQHFVGIKFSTPAVEKSPPFWKKHFISFEIIICWSIKDQHFSFKKVNTPWWWLESQLRWLVGFFQIQVSRIVLERELLKM